MKRILNASKTPPLDIKEKIAAQFEVTQETEKIKQLISSKIDSMEGLITIKLLQKAIKRELGFELKRHRIYTILTKEMALAWRRVRPQARYVNSLKNIQLRQAFARKLLEVMSEQKVNISFDESVIRGSTGRCYSWARRGDGAMRYYNKEVSDLAILVAMTSKGEIIF